MEAARLRQQRALTEGSRRWLRNEIQRIEGRVADAVADTEAMKPRWEASLATIQKRRGKVQELTAKINVDLKGLPVQFGALRGQWLEARGAFEEELIYKPTLIEQWNYESQRTQATYAYQVSCNRFERDHIRPYCGASIEKRVTLEENVLAADPVWDERRRPPSGRVSLYYLPDEIGYEARQRMLSHENAPKPQAKAEREAFGAITAAFVGDLIPLLDWAIAVDQRQEAVLQLIPLEQAHRALEKVWRQAQRELREAEQEGAKIPDLQAKLAVAPPEAPAAPPADHVQNWRYAIRIGAALIALFAVYYLMKRSSKAAV